jgi:hypothetical protein
MSWHIREKCLAKSEKVKANRRQRLIVKLKFRNMVERAVLLLYLTSGANTKSKSLRVA